MNLHKKVLQFYVVCLIAFCIWIAFVILHTNHHKENDIVEEYEEYGEKLVGDYQKNCDRKETAESIPVSNTSIQNTINLEEIYYLFNEPFLCSKHQQILLLVVVVSDPLNKKKRNILRETWTKPLSLSKNSAVLFFLGLNQDEKVNSQVYQECEEHGDMVVVDFDDTYKNLSLKLVVMLGWIQEFCPNAQYVLKCDDNVFVNVYNLVDFTLNGHLDQSSFYGNMLHRDLPIRDSNSSDNKWLATIEEFPDTFYPDYITGATYLFGTQRISNLLNACLKIPYFYLEDVFITGLCAKEANFCRKLQPRFVNGPIPNRKCTVFSIISVLTNSEKTMKTLWNRIQDFSAYKQCNRKKPANFLTKI